MLQRVIYVSDAVGTAGASVLSMAQILGVSDANNRRDHLTGVLVFHSGQFMQVIEGARVDLDRLLKRLHDDPRHINLRLLTNTQVEGRRFVYAPMTQVEITGDIAEMIGDRPLDALSLPQVEAVFAKAEAQLDLTG